MAISAIFLSFLVLLPAAYAVDYTVGDSSGWNQGVNYASWASGKTFAVGDKLVFNYAGSSHSLDVVSKSDYDSCATGNALESHNDGSTTITLNRSGTMYFLCPSFGHCGGGMKLAVTVAAGSGGSPTTPTPTTPSPTTPSDDTPSNDTPPKTPSKDTPNSNGATGSLMVVGASILFAPLLALLG